MYAQKCLSNRNVFEQVVKVGQYKFYFKEQEVSAKFEAFEGAHSILCPFLCHRSFNENLLVKATTS